MGSDVDRINVFVKNIICSGGGVAAGLSRCFLRGWLEFSSDTTNVGRLLVASSEETTSEENIEKLKVTFLRARRT